MGGPRTEAQALRERGLPGAAVLQDTSRGGGGVRRPALGASLRIGSLRSDEARRGTPASGGFGAGAAAERAPGVLESAGRGGRCEGDQPLDALAAWSEGWERCSEAEGPHVPSWFPAFLGPSRFPAR